MGGDLPETPASPGIGGRRCRPAPGRVQPAGQWRGRETGRSLGAGAVPGDRDLDQAPPLPPYGAPCQGHPQSGALLRGDRHERAAGDPRPRMIEGLAQLLDMGEGALAGLALVFMRVGGIVALLPGFGEASVPLRIRLGIAIAFTMVVWPMLAEDLIAVDPG